MPSPEIDSCLSRWPKHYANHKLIDFLSCYRNAGNQETLVTMVRNINCGFDNQCNHGNHKNIGNLGLHVKKF